MIDQGKTGSLTAYEKRIVKYLIDEGQSNQDIQALINLERPSTINFSRISSVKSDTFQGKCTHEEFAQYEAFKRSFDLKTGLNPFADERLIKSREAMKLAIGSFNNPAISFRDEVFSVLANIAWTYLAIEFSSRNDLPTVRKNGRAISLSDFIDSAGCPFSAGVKNNLRALIKLRDATEHTVLGPSEAVWVAIFQANCSNYEMEITRLFGQRLSMSSEVSFALQLSSLSVGQAVHMANLPVPQAIQSINKEIFDHLSKEEMDDRDFQFSVVYTTVSASKSKAAIKFVSPETAEGKDIANILVKYKPSDETHPYKPKEVINLVKRSVGRSFKMTDHTTFWKKHGVRPDGTAQFPENTDIRYCYYSKTHKIYTYSEAWVDLICRELKN